MNNITFVLFSYNEEKRIAYAIRNFIDFGEVLVLDGGSTDNTKQITESLGAKFLERPKTDKPFVENQENFDFIKKHAKTNWIYWGYTDNIAPRPLIVELVKIAGQDKIKKVLIPLHTYIWGQTKYVSQELYIPAFFHKDFMDFRDNHIHGMGRFTGTDDQVRKLPNDKELALQHFSTYNESKFVSGHFRYAEEESKFKFESGEKFSLLKMFAAMIRYCWYYRKSLRNGKIGFIIMGNYAFSRFMTYARLYEREHDITLESIEEAYSKEKERLLQR